MASLSRSLTQKEAKKPDAKRPPKFMQKVKLGQLMGAGDRQKEKEQPISKKSEEVDHGKTESAKQTPNTATLD